MRPGAKASGLFCYLRLWRQCCSSNRGKCVLARGVSVDALRKAALRLKPLCETQAALRCGASECYREYECLHCGASERYRELERFGITSKIRSETPAKMPGMAPPVKESKSPLANTPTYPMRAKAIPTSPLIFRALLTSSTGAILLSCRLPHWRG